MSHCNRLTTRTYAQSVAVAALLVAISAFASLVQAQYYPHGNSYQNNCSYPTRCLPQSPYYSNPSPTVNGHSSATGLSNYQGSTSGDQVERTVGACYGAGPIGVCVDNQGTLSVDAGELARGEVYVGQSSGACFGGGVSGRLGPVGVEASATKCLDSRRGLTDQLSFQAGPIQYTETRPVHPR
ncbi:MAG TPA: hypothetical protein VMH22_09120 [bacterium]|nr:hypothetical protein [bacterium]